MNKEKQPPEGKNNPIPALIAKGARLARAELPVIGGAVISMGVFAMLMRIEYIAPEFMILLDLATIICASARSGAIWQRVCGGRKER